MHGSYRPKNTDIFDPNIIEKKYRINKPQSITEKLEQELELPSQSLYEFLNTKYDPTVLQKRETYVERYPQYKGEILFGPKKKEQHTATTYRISDAPKIQHNKIFRPV